MDNVEELVIENIPSFPPNDLMSPRSQSRKGVFSLFFFSSIKGSAALFYSFYACSRWSIIHIYFLVPVLEISISAFYAILLFLPFFFLS